MAMNVAQNLQTVDLDTRYSMALAAYFVHADENSLSHAYDIARMAFNQGVGFAAFYEIHRNATASLGRQSCNGSDRFFYEALSVYDTALRGHGQPPKNGIPRFRERNRVEFDLREAKFDLTRQRDDLDDLVAQRTGELLFQFEEMKRLNNQLKQTNQEQAEFTYAISHDLMSPLNTISMMLSFLEEDLLGDAAPHILEPLDAARTTAARMLKIVEDILSYSRAIGQNTKFEPVDLNILFQDILSDLKSDLDHKEAVIKLARLPEIKGVKIQLRLLFQNLLSNALKFRHPNRVPIVQIATRPSEAGTLVLSIKDNGIGIEEQHFARIFGLFQRLHTFEEYNGTGLGLTLCKRIAGNHGGEIHVASQPGEGSTFTITLQTHE